MVAGRASSPDKVPLLTMEQTPRPGTGNIGSINNAKKIPSGREDNSILKNLAGWILM